MGDPRQWQGEALKHCPKRHRLMTGDDRARCTSRTKHEPVEIMADRIGRAASRGAVHTENMRP